MAKNNKKSASKACDVRDLQIKFQNLITALSVMSILLTPIITTLIAAVLIFYFLLVIVVGTVDDGGDTPNQTC